MTKVSVQTHRKMAQRVGTETPKGWSLSPLKYFHTEQEPWVFVWPELVQTADDANAGLLLADIVRWFRLPDDEQPLVRRNRCVDVNGEPWLAKPRPALVMETGLTDSQVKRALTRLRDGQLIERSGRHELLRPTRTFEPTNDRGIKVYARMVHMTHSAAQGIILSQMHYWFSPGKDQTARVTQQYQGKYWWATRFEDLAAQAGLSVRSARSAVESLNRRGLIHKILSKE